MIAFAGGTRQAAETPASSSAADGGDSGSHHGGGGGSESSCYDIGAVRTQRRDSSGAAAAVGKTGGRSGPLEMPSTSPLVACGTDKRRINAGVSYPATAGSAGGQTLPKPYVLYESDASEIVVQLIGRSALASLSPFVIRYEGRVNFWRVVVAKFE